MSGGGGEHEWAAAGAHAAPVNDCTHLQRQPDPCVSICLNSRFEHRPSPVLSARSSVRRGSCAATGCIQLPGSKLRKHSGRDGRGDGRARVDSAQPCDSAGAHRGVNLIRRLEPVPHTSSSPLGNHVTQQRVLTSPLFAADLPSVRRRGAAAGEDDGCTVPGTSAAGSLSVASERARQVRASRPAHEVSRPRSP